MINKETLNRAVIELVGEANAELWWASPNKGFDNKTPNEAYLEDPDMVREYLLWHTFGSGG